MKCKLAKKTIDSNNFWGAKKAHVALTGGWDVWHETEIDNWYLLIKRGVNLLIRLEKLGQWLEVKLKFFSDYINFNFFKILFKFQN